MIPENLQEVAWKVADVRTSPAQLSEIFEDAAFMAALRDTASNPQLPFELLAQLAVLCPREIAANPALEVLRDDAQRQQFSLHAAFKLLGVGNVPLWLVELFVSFPNSWIAGEARGHVKLVGEAGVNWNAELQKMLSGYWPSEVTHSRYAGKFKELHAILAARPECEWVLVPMEKVFAVCEEAQLRNAVCNSPRIKPLLDLLRRAGSAPFLMDFAVPEPLTIQEREELLGLGPWGRCLVARHPQTPLDLLERLADEAVRFDVSNKPLLMALAGNPQVAPELLERWSHDVISQLRGLVARHPNTLPTTLAHLASDPVRRARMDVAHHPQTTFETLSMLAGDPDSKVRGAVARRASCPPPLLELLACDDNAFVRLDVARHSGASQLALKFLVEDKDADILGVLAQRPDLAPALRERIAGRRTQVAQRGLSRSDEQRVKDRHASEATLRELAHSASGNVRCLVAQHARTPLEVVRALAAQPRVSDALAWSRSIPPRVLDIALRGAYPRTKIFLADNPSVPFDVLQSLCETAFAQISEAYHFSTNDWNAYVKTLEALANSEGVLERASWQEKFAKYWRESLMPRLQALFDQPRLLNPEHRYPDRLDNVGSYDGYAVCLARIQKLSRREVAAPLLKSRPDASRETIPQDWLRPLNLAPSVAILSCSDVPRERLRYEVVSRSGWLLRLAAARNPSTPRRVVEELTRDGNSWVRAAARESLASGVASDDFVEYERE